MRLVNTFATLALVLSTAGATWAALPDEKVRRKAQGHFQEGLDAMQAERWDDAEREFKSAVKVWPGYPEAHYQLGQVHMARKAYPDAVRCYLASRDGFAALVAERLAAESRNDQSAQELILALQDSQRQIESGKLKGIGSHEAIKNENKIKQLETQRRRAPTVVDEPAYLPLALGSAYLRSGDMAGAEREYLKAISVKSDYGEAHNNLAVVYLQTGRFAQARTEVTEAKKAGFPVHPGLQTDIEKRAAAAGQ